MARKEKTHREKLIIVPSANEILSETPPVRESTLDRIYRENGITFRDVQQQPKMEKILNYVGGLDAFAEYLRGSEDADARKFVEVYDRVYDHRDFLEFQGICAAAKISGKKLTAALLVELSMESDQEIALISSIKMPTIVNYTAEMALTPQGHRERTLMAKATGYLPRPKGSQTNIQINTANGASGGQQNTTLPAHDQDIRELGERFHSMTAAKEPKMLEGKV